MADKQRANGLDATYLTPHGDTAAADILESRLSEGGHIVKYGSAEWLARMSAYSPQGEQTPAFVIECATEQDVVESVIFAKSLNLPVTARSGAHNLAELSNVQGGVIISQSSRNTVRHDLVAKTVTFEGAAQFTHIDTYLHKEAPGWVMQSSMIASIGVTGSHFAVGVGWLHRKLGNGIDNVVAVRIVLADGTVAVASADENSDLWYALRGAAPSFGIITEVTERIHQICDPKQGKEVRVGCFFFDLEHGEKVWDTITAASNDPNFPDEAFILPLFSFVDGKPGILLWYLQYLFDAEKGAIVSDAAAVWEAKFQALVDATSPLLRVPNSLAVSEGNGWEYISHMETQLLFAPPWMCSFYPYGGFVARENEDTLFFKVLDHWRNAKQPDGAEEVPFHTTAFYHFGGTKLRERAPSAWPGNAQTAWLCATWGGVLTDQDPKVRVQRRAQTQEWVDALRAKTAGDLQFAYICSAAYNWRSINHARWIHGPSFDKLVEIKTKYDPENMFSNNVNIPPKRQYS